MTTIPNELIIEINTSIPGYQKIKYKPSMTIKNISSDDNKIRFNPLIKLNKNKIDKIPEDLRKKEFFNKGLFDSLINYTNGQPVKNLQQATVQGYIDNNIKVTIDTIFSENSIIYIGGKPYIIVDSQWSTGDWKIDIKKTKEEIDSSKITNPLLYQAIVKDEIISGEEQIQSLNNNLIYGANYNGPKNENVASGLEQETKKPMTDIIVTSKPQIKQPDDISLPAKEMKQLPPIPPEESVATTQQKEMKQLPPIPPEESVATTQQKEMKQLPPIFPEESVASTQQKEMKQLPPIPPEEPEIIEIINPPIKSPRQPLSYAIEPINKFKTSEKTTSFVKNILKNLQFYNLQNYIYIASENDTKRLITNTLKNTTTINFKETDSKNLSLTAYKEIVDGVKVVENSGGGDCFFIAVADAINYYNYYNQNNRIISKIYGSGQNLFTQIYLRTLVYDFIETFSELDSLLYNIAPVNAENLNNIFEKSLNGLKQNLIESSQTDDISKETYIELANNTYKQNDNFFVKNINSIPFEIENYEKPFRPLNKSELKNYILSNNYWANDIAIFALCEKLKLNIIPINIKKNNISIPFANFGIEYNKWNKYLFLYYNNSHYELMTFNYKKRDVKYDTAGNVSGIKTNLEKKTIFERNVKTSDGLPPIFMLFIIFGAWYINITDDKQNFTYQKEIMNMMSNSINKLYKTTKYNKFYSVFKSYFPNSRIQMPELSLNTGIQSGGVLAYKVMKTEDTQLAYHISVYLELHPGTSITPIEIKKLKCRQKWNSVRKAWSDFTGKPYIIPPVYNNTKTLKNNEQKAGNKTQYKRIFNNDTRKNNRIRERNNITLKKGVKL